MWGWAPSRIPVLFWAAQGILPSLLLGDISAWEIVGAWSCHGLSKPAGDAQWYISLITLILPQFWFLLGRIMPSHKALWVILKVVRNCFTVSPHGSLCSDLIHLPDGMFLLAASLNFYLFHFPRAQVAARTEVWLSSLWLSWSIYYQSFLRFHLAISSFYFFLHEDTTIAEELKSDLLPHWFLMGAHQNERAFIICSLVTLQYLSNI